MDEQVKVFVGHDELREVLGKYISGRDLDKLPQGLILKGRLTD